MFIFLIVIVVSGSLKVSGFILFLIFNLLGSVVC